MGQETDREPDRGEEQAEPFAAFCGEMMSEMTRCGPMMQRMMARCMAMWERDSSCGDDRDPTDD
ncbi:MAG: hypothetical protein ACYS0D_12565 [Planctomycetota bacterium]|jgi:hypothetical protein